MHSNTKKRIEFLQSYVRQKAKIWFRKYGHNISSISVDKKNIGNERKNYYSIVFNVVQKIEKNNLNKNEHIPKSFNVKFPDGKVRTIKTDVKQTGIFKFQAKIMDAVSDSINSDPGTLSLLLKDKFANIFGLTNYHVAAQKLFNQGIYSFNSNDTNSNYIVDVNGARYKLHKGVFKHSLDVAYILLGKDISVSNDLHDGSRIDNSTFIEGPIPATAIDQPILLYLRSQQGQIINSILNNQVALSYHDVRFEDLIIVSRCTRGGDSGSIVVDNRRRVLGIVLGRDEDYTYIIPYYKIHMFYPLQIL